MCWHNCFCLSSLQSCKLNQELSASFTHYIPAAASKLLQLCPILCDPIDCSHQAPLSLGFSRQEHWNGLPFPSPKHESEK